MDTGVLGKLAISPDQIPSPVDPGPVTIGIRPEMLTMLFDEQNQSEFELQGEIHESAYFGEMTYYTVKVIGLDAPLTISIRNSAGRPVLQDGDSARIGLGTESLVILDESNTIKNAKKEL